jgi:hypothetical protein
MNPYYHHIGKIKPSFGSISLFSRKSKQFQNEQLSGIILQSREKVPQQKFFDASPFGDLKNSVISKKAAEFAYASLSNGMQIT